MKSVVSAKDLKAAVAVVAPISKGASAMPIINHVLVIATLDGIRIEATDIETQVTATIPGKVEKIGRSTVEGARLSAISRLLPAGADVTFSRNGSKGTVSCDGDTFELLTLDVADFPEWVIHPHTHAFEVPQKTLRTMLETVGYAVADGKDGRRVLFGILLELTGGKKLRLIATNGRVMSSQWDETHGLFDGKDLRTILPARSADQLRKALGDEGVVTVRLSDRQLEFATDAWTIRTQAIEGKYPNIDAVVPKDFSTKVTFDREVMLAALRRAGIVADAANRSVLMEVTEDGGDKGRACCSFRAMAHDVGSFAGKIPVNYSGPAFKVAFNCSLLIDTLSVFEVQSLVMNGRNSTAPVVFLDPKQENRFSLLMPIKLSEVPAEGDEDDGEKED